MEPEIQKRRISRRDAIKAGGIAAVGLAFSKPVIETIYPRPAFAQLSPGDGMTQIDPPTLNPLGACHFGPIGSDGVDAQQPCSLLTESQCREQGGSWAGPGSDCSDNQP